MNIENMKSFKAKYGHPFVYKTHNSSPEEAPVVCATTLIVKFLNGGGYSVFYMQYVMISPYKLEVKYACGYGL